MQSYESVGQKTCTVARYIEGRYVTGKKLSFISLLEDDLRYFSQDSQRNLVLLFPPFLPKFRWLAHKVIEQFYPDICSVSIGDDEYRQIVVSRRTILFRYCRPFKCAHKKLGSLNQKGHTADCSCNTGVIYSPNEILYKQDVEENHNNGKPIINTQFPISCSASEVQLDMSGNNMDEKLRKNEKCKRRRPDKAIYVPRALRSKENNECYLQDIENKSFLEKKEHMDGVEELVNCLTPFKLKDSNGTTLNHHIPLIQDSDSTAEENHFNQHISEEHHTVLNTADDLSKGHDTVYIGKGYDKARNVTENIWTQTALNCPEKSENSKQTLGQTDLHDFDLHLASYESGQLDLTVDSCTPLSPSEKSSATTCVSYDMHNSHSSMSKEDSWDSMFNDSGECLNPNALKELTAIVGNTDVHLSRNDYSEFKLSSCEPEPKQDLNGEKFSHVVELYAFPVEFSTQDLVSALSCFKAENFVIKWVDDSHALAVFSGAFAAAQAVLLEHPFVKIRPLSQGLKSSQLKARKLMMSMEPVKPRPATTATLARRLVTGALGIRITIPKEQREMERKKILEAKAQREQVAKQRKKMWEGIVPE